MSKYASLLFPVEEYHEIGPFRFPIYHDLVPGEARKIEDITRQQTKATFKSIKLAQKIAKDKGITTKEAVELLSKVEDDTELLYEYASELEDVNSISEVDTKVAYVTVFMQFRGEAKLTEANDWIPVSDWCQADTEKMPTKYLNEIFQLVLWERSGWPDVAEGNDQKNEEPTPLPKKS